MIQKSTVLYVYRKLRLAGILGSVVFMLAVFTQLNWARFQIIRDARIENVGKSQSCMVSKLRIIWKETTLG